MHQHSVIDIFALVLCSSLLFASPTGDEIDTLYTITGQSRSWRRRRPKRNAAADRRRATQGGVQNRRRAVRLGKQTRHTMAAKGMRNRWGRNDDGDHRRYQMKDVSFMPYATGRSARPANTRPPSSIPSYGRGQRQSRPSTSSLPSMRSCDQPSIEMANGNLPSTLATHSVAFFQRFRCRERRRDAGQAAMEDWHVRRFHMMMIYLPDAIHVAAGILSSFASFI